MKKTGRESQRPRFSGIHGGYIESVNGIPVGSGDFEDDSPRVEVVVRRDPPPPASTEATTSGHAEGINAIERALGRTPIGRQAITLMGELAKLRIMHALAVDLVRSSQEDIDRLRRALMGRDLLARERAAAQVPYAQSELAKWQRVASDYETRRDQLEYALRDTVRALTP